MSKEAIESMLEKGYEITYARPSLTRNYVYDTHSGDVRAAIVSMRMRGFRIETRELNNKIAVKCV